MFRVEDSRSRAGTVLSMKLRSFLEASERRSTASVRCLARIFLYKCGENVGREKRGQIRPKASLLTGSGQATHIEKAALFLLKSGMMYFGAYQAGPSKPRTMSETPRRIGRVCARRSAKHRSTQKRKRNRWIASCETESCST